MTDYVARARNDFDDFWFELFIERAGIIEDGCKRNSKEGLVNLDRQTAEKKAYEFIVNQMNATLL